MAVARISGLNIHADAASDAAVISAFWRFTIFALAVALSGCAQDVPPISCQLPDFQCYEDQAVKGIVVVRQDISYWANINLLGQVAIAIFGIVATVMIALQGDQNKYWTRPIGLVATSLVTGLTSALVTFHIPENVDKLVDIVDKMVIATNDFSYQIDELKAGKSKDDIVKAYRSDAEFRNKANGLAKKFVDQYNTIKVDMLRLSGSAVRLRGPLSSIASQPSAKETPLQK